jgi:hypothetical protein
MHDLKINYIFKDGRILPASEKDFAQLALFTKTLKENQTLEVYMSPMHGSDATLGQLAKIHAMIKELSMFTGEGFADLKNVVKHKAGLYNVVDSRSGEVEFKSFGKCSKTELSKAIEACLEIGDAVGYSLH